MGLINRKMVHNIYLKSNSKSRPERVANCVLMTKWPASPKNLIKFVYCILNKLKLCDFASSYQNRVQVKLVKISKFFFLYYIMTTGSIRQISLIPKIDFHFHQKSLLILKLKKADLPQFHNHSRHSKMCFAASPITLSLLQPVISNVCLLVSVKARRKLLPWDSKCNNFWDSSFARVKWLKYTNSKVFHIGSALILHDTSENCI